MNIKPPPPTETWKYVYGLTYLYAKALHPKGPESLIESEANSFAQIIIQSFKGARTKEESRETLIKLLQKNLSDEEKIKSNFTIQLADKKLALNPGLVDPEDDYKDQTQIENRKRIVKEAIAETNVILSRKCKVCGLKNTLPKPVLQTCAKCKNAWYCSKEHQKQDWPRHRLTDCISKQSEFLL